MAVGSSGVAAGCLCEVGKCPRLRPVGTVNVFGRLEAGSCKFISLGPLDEVGSEAELCVHSALGTQGLGNACSSPPGPIGGQDGEADGEELQRKGVEMLPVMPKIVSRAPQRRALGKGCFKNRFESLRN